MSVQIVTPPPSEPVSLGEAKLFARIDDGAEDSLVSNLIAVARHMVEHVSGRALVTRRVLETRDAWSPEIDGKIRLALAPSPVIHAVRLAKAGNAPIIVDPASFVLDRALGELSFSQGAPPVRQAFAGIEIEYDAGYGAAADIPVDLRQAVLIATAALYEARTEPDQIQSSIARLVAPYQRVRL